MRPADPGTTDGPARTSGQRARAAGGEQAANTLPPAGSSRHVTTADTKVIVVNPLRIPARRASDIAHELAHLLLALRLDELRIVAGVPFRTCRPDQEEEATNLGGALLLPRPLLLSAVRRGLDEQAIAAQYDVTTEMARSASTGPASAGSFATPASVATSVHDSRLILPPRY